MGHRRAVIGAAAVIAVLASATAALPDNHDGERPAGARHHHEAEVSDGQRRAGAGVGTDSGQPGAGVDVQAWAHPAPTGESGDDGGAESGAEGGGGSDQGGMALPPDLPGDDADLTLPDLVPRPAYRVVIAEADGPLTGVDAALNSPFGGHEHHTAGPVLRFTTTIDNLAEHSFELLAHPAEPDPGSDEVATTDALQCVRFEGPVIEGAQRACRQYVKVGTLTYHAHHRHLHIDGFAVYELRHDADGLPMYGSPEAIVARSDKVGWCVSDMAEPRDPDGFPEPYRPWYVECSRAPSPVPARMGISPGWGDTYHSRFAGQQIPLDGVPDGVYWITIRVNPPDNPFGLAIREADHTRNSSWTRVRIHGGGTQVEVLGEMHPARDHYSADPAFMIERRHPTGAEPARDDPED